MKLTSQIKRCEMMAEKIMEGAFDEPVGYELSELYKLTAELFQFIEDIYKRYDNLDQHFGEHINQKGH